MTHYTAADLCIADRHLAEGDARLAQQAVLLTSLRARGLPTVQTESLLRLFEACQEQHRAHRQAITEALERAAL